MRWCAAAVVRHTSEAEPCCCVQQCAIAVLAPQSSRVPAAQRCCRNCVTLYANQSISALCELLQACKLDRGLLASVLQAASCDDLFSFSWASAPTLTERLSGH